MKTGLAVFTTLVVFFSSNFLSMAAEMEYPQKDIEIIGSYRPGAGTDLGARMLAENSKAYLGKDVIVINKPGGGGQVAVTLLAKEKPDGYTLGSTDSNVLVLKPHLRKTSYKFEDFTYIIQFGVLDLGIAVPADSPFQSLNDMMEYARKNPDKVTVSNVGPGSTGDLTCRALSHLGGVKIKSVPFNGAAASVTAMLGHHVMASAIGFSGFAQHLKANKVRLLALMGKERKDASPDVPTLNELGYPLILQALYVIIGPKGMDKDHVKKLETAFRKGMESPGFKKLAKDLAINASNPLSGDALLAELKKRNKENLELVRKLGMEVKD